MADFKPLNDAIEQAGRRRPDFKPLLDDVNLRVIVEKDIAHVWRTGEGAATSFPIGINRMVRGFYYMEHDDQGRLLRMSPLADDKIYFAAVKDRKLVFVDETGMIEVQPPMITEIKEGFGEYAAKRANTSGVFWATLDMVPSKSKSQPPPAYEEFPLRFYPQVYPADLPKVLAEPSTLHEPASISGPGPGVSRFWPDHYEDKPLDFTFVAHNGYAALVKRRRAGRDFHYWVPLNDLQQYLQSYVIDTVAKNTAGMGIFVQMLTEIAISFVPIVGPLYNLVQTGRNVYSAYKNWGKISGWEKALVGLDVLLTTVTVAPTAVRAAKGIAKTDDGIRALMKAGLPKSEARTLMLGAGAFQDVSSTRTVVETLIQELQAGKALSAKQIRQIEGVLEEMLKRLPKTERALAAARFAMTSPQRARSFLHGLDVTEDVFKGLQNLAPEAIVGIKALAKEGRNTLALRLAHWAKDGDVALGFNKLAGTAKLGHVTDLAAALGEDMLRLMGQKNFRFGTDLADLVRAQSGSGKAYKALMKGGKLKGGKVVLGLDDLLIQARSSAGSLKAELDTIQKKTAVFLSETQLEGLGKLSEKARDLILAAPDSQLREIAKIASASPDAVKGIERMTTAFAGKLKAGVFPGVVERLGSGLLAEIERFGLTFSADLAKEMGKKVGAADAVKILLKGVKGRKPTAGMLDQLAAAIGTEARLMEILKRVQNPTQRAELFSRWAVKNPTLVPGIASIQKLRPSDAQERIMAIYRDFDDKAARAVFEEIGKIDAAGPPNGLSSLIADLAGGPDKAMGASLTLHYAVQQLDPKKIEAFEEVFKAYDRAVRKYDMVAGGKYFEFKYWLGYGGKKVAAAADEFRRDILIHAKNGFQDLRWVFSKEVANYRDVIAGMMYDTLKANKQAVKELGLDFMTVARQLETAIDSPSNWLIRFQ